MKPKNTALSLNTGIMEIQPEVSLFEIEVVFSLLQEKTLDLLDRP